MINSLAKRRKQSRDFSVSNKTYIPRQVSCIYSINTYQSNQGLRQRPINRSVINLNSLEFSKKINTQQTDPKLNQRISILDQKFNSINNRIKSLFRVQQSSQKKQNFYPCQIMAFHDRGRGSLSKKSQKQYGENNPSLNQSLNFPYYIECIKRRSIVSTQIRMHIYNSILTFKQYLKCMHNLRPKIPDPKIPPQIQNRKTIVFDMDQTLIHTNQVMVKGYQIKVPFKTIQGKIISGYVCVRPYAKQIIKRLSQYFDIIIFTAGNQCYADPILDYIDPTKCIKYRLYRQSCTMVNNQLFVKDLRILGRRLENVVLVDNAPYSYMLQLMNGIPILNYYKGQDDNQLYQLESYLMSLLGVDDVRKVNNEVFRLLEYIKYDHHETLIQQLYFNKV